MDTVAEKVGPLKMGVMGHLVVITSMLVFLSQLKMLVKTAGMVVISVKGNVAGVVHMDTVAEKVGPLKMGVMGQLVVITSMLVFLGQLARKWAMAMELY